MGKRANGRTGETVRARALRAFVRGRGLTGAFPLRDRVKPREVGLDPDRPARGQARRAGIEVKSRKGVASARPVARSKPVSPRDRRPAYHRRRMRQNTPIARLYALPIGAPIAPPVLAPAIDPAAPPRLAEDVHGLAWGESPVDTAANDPDGARAGLGWTSSILVISSVLLLGLNSFAIDKWARELEINRVTGPVQGYALAWHQAMHRLHLDAPVVEGRAAWHWLKALKWPGAVSAAGSGEETRDAR